MAGGKKVAKYGLGIEVIERNGRYTWNGEDWGAVIPVGSPLPCCGCALSTMNRKPEICDDCRCHEVARFVQRFPFDAVS